MTTSPSSTTRERVQPDEEGFTPNGREDPYPHSDFGAPCTSQCCEPPQGGRPVVWNCSGDLGCMARLREPGEFINCCPPAVSTAKETR